MGQSIQHPCRLFKQYDHEGAFTDDVLARKNQGDWHRQFDSLSPCRPRTRDPGCDRSITNKERGRRSKARLGRTIHPAFSFGEKQKDLVLFFHHARGKAIRIGN